MPSYGNTWRQLATRWDGATLTRRTMATAAAQTCLEHKARYVIAAQRFSEAHPGADIPWYFIGPIHYREADFNFHTQLAQGDPLDEISRHVPRGQGPYFGPDAWERAAIIALETDKLQDIRDWNLEKLLFYWEAYNGFGYRNHGVSSPYVWAGTSIYSSGMYVADGEWNRNARDPRVGCAAILKCLMGLDPTIQPQRET